MVNFTLANQAMDLKLTLANRKCYLHPCRIVIPWALLNVKRDIFYREHSQNINIYLNHHTLPSSPHQIRSHRFFPVSQTCK